MDISSVRLLLPCFILYAFYWSLFLNPYVEEPGNRLDSVRVQRMLNRTRHLMEEQKFQEAFKPAQDLYKSHPENPVYIELLARIYNRLERWPQEAEMWEKFLAYSPLPVEGCPQIGVAYRRMNREEDAFRSFERCLAIETNSDNLMFMGHALERRWLYKKAEEHYNRALAMAPEYPDVIIGKARCEIRRGLAASAKERILKLLERRPENADALLAAAMACIRNREYREAREYIARGRRIRPDDGDFRVLLVKAGRRKGG